MEIKEKKKKFDQDFNVEDYDIDGDNEQSQENNQQIELHSVDSKNENNKVLKSFDEPKIENKLSKDSKFDLLVRIILISSALIFIPLSYMVTDNFEEVENNIIFYNIKNLVSREYLSNKSPTNIFYYSKIIQDKDFMCGISCILYHIPTIFAIAKKSAG